MTFLITLLLLAALATWHTVRLTRSDGRGRAAPPVSHDRDRQFLPPALR